MIYLVVLFLTAGPSVFAELSPLRLTGSTLVFLQVLNVSARLILFVFVAINGIRLAKELEGEKALPYQIAFCIPCLNLIPLLILSSRSNRIMRENGIKVGFLGVSPSDIP